MFTNLQAMDTLCDPEVDFCDSEIPLNGIDQAFSPEGLKVIGYLALIKVILPASIAGSMVDFHLEENDLPYY